MVSTPPRKISDTPGACDPAKTSRAIPAERESPEPSDIESAHRRHPGMPIELRSRIVRVRFAAALQRVPPENVAVRR